MSNLNGVLDALEQDISTVNLDETAKQELTKKLVETVMPIVCAWEDKVSEGLIEASSEESGWCKFRDKIVLPYTLKSLAYFGRQVLLSTMEHTIEA